MFLSLSLSLSHLNTVPARFVEHLTSSDLVTPEDSSVSLRCVANGFPMPEIKWRREDGQVINIRSGAERGIRKGMEQDLGTETVLTFHSSCELFSLLD